MILVVLIYQPNHGNQQTNNHHKNWSITTFDTNKKKHFIELNDQYLYVELHSLGIDSSVEIVNSLRVLNYSTFKILEFELFEF